MAEHLQRAEPDLLRSMLSTLVQSLMSAEADATWGAPYGSMSQSLPQPDSKESQPERLSRQP